MRGVLAHRTHLGQYLVYASGLEVVAAVWISPRFRDEFRRALDWLNERTDVKVAFFGVEVGVVRIGDTAPCAPVFEIVSRPNNWQKNVKAADTGASSQPNISPLNAARQNFFLEVLTDLTEFRPAIRLPFYAAGQLALLPLRSLRVLVHLDRRRWPRWVRGLSGYRRR